ncbi:hypothetical protein BC831DRAFT_228397 [Entophlyctis helioformis]|nr:hypothetical protein BC831DRAFT_228397 [Entophlyctis helioformis]
MNTSVGDRNGLGSPVSTQGILAQAQYTPTTAERTVIKAANESFIMSYMLGIGLGIGSGVYSVYKLKLRRSSWQSAVVVFVCATLGELTGRRIGERSAQGILHRRLSDDSQLRVLLENNKRGISLPKRPPAQRRLACRGRQCFGRVHQRLAQKPEHLAVAVAVAGSRHRSRSRCHLCRIGHRRPSQQHRGTASASRAPASLCPHGIACVAARQQRLTRHHRHRVTAMPRQALPASWLHTRSTMTTTTTTICLAHTRRAHHSSNSSSSSPHNQQQQPTSLALASRCLPSRETKRQSPIRTAIPSTELVQVAATQ